MSKLDEKYIGLGLAICSSIAIGTSFIITKKGLNDAAERTRAINASDDLTYLRNPIWWAGMSLLVIGEVANFAAYSFAPPILVTPLGFLSVLIGAILASIFLQESLGHIGRIGCSLCILGAIIIVAHAPPDREINTVDQILFFAVQPGEYMLFPLPDYHSLMEILGFLLYCFTVLAYTGFAIHTLVPRYGKTSPLVYISICSLVGSVSVMAAKGFGIAIKLTLGGSNQFGFGSTYLFGITCAGCIVVQMNYFNKALDGFSTNVVNPIYYVTFTTATIIASLILFQGFNTTDAVNTISLIDGFLVTFLGVHLLNSSLDAANGPFEHGYGNGRVPFENGVLTPRVSLSGRVSLDGWGNGSGGGHRRHWSRDSMGGGAPPLSARSNSHPGRQTLFNTYEHDEPDDGIGGPGMSLDALREEEEGEAELGREEDYDVDGDELESDERTRLRKEQARRGNGRRGRGL